MESVKAENLCSQLFNQNNFHQPWDNAKATIFKTFSLKEFAIREFGKNGASMHDNLKRYGDEYLNFLVDLPLMSHYKQFSKFLKMHPRMSAETSRVEFSKILGKKIVYRALTLTENEFQNILINGMDSPFLFNPRNGATLEQKTATLQRELSDGLVASLQRRYSSAKLTSNPFLSVSDYPDLAASVAKTFVKNDPGKSIYVFELEVPAVEIIKLGRIIPYGGLIQQLRVSGFQSKTVHQGGPVGTYRLGPKVESFLFYRVDSSSFRRIFSIEIPDAPVHESAFGEKAEPLDRELYLSTLKQLR